MLFDYSASIFASKIPFLFRPADATQGTTMAHGTLTEEKRELAGDVFLFPLFPLPESDVWYFATVTG